LFWTIPVAALSAVSNLQNLSQIPALGFLVSSVSNNLFIKQLLDDSLPSLALWVFMALLPFILRGIIVWRAWTLKREEDTSLMRTYWIFLLLNVFLVTSLAGSVFRVLDDFLEYPRKKFFKESKSSS